MLDKNLNQSTKILKIGFFGTSIMQHLEGYVPQLYDQMNLPDIGFKVEVIDWRKRWYVSMLENYLTISYPSLSFNIDNHGVGWATTRRILKEIDKRVDYERQDHFDICFVSGGVNDVLRKFQWREDEAVEIDEFKQNYQEMISKLQSVSKIVVCLTETPFGFDQYEYANELLNQYNKVVHECALKANVIVIDLHTAFMNYVANGWNSSSESSLWSDWVHLTELGDTLVFKTISDYLNKHQIIEYLTIS